MILFLILFSFLDVSFAACPDGSISLPSNFQGKWKCISIVPQEQSFSMAELDCQRNDGHLITVDNFSINHFIKQQVQLTLFSEIHISKYWVGVSDITGKGWENIDDGSKTAFFNWEHKEPSSASGQRGCVSMDISGYWYSNDCSNNLPYVCGVNEIEVPLPNALQGVPPSIPTYPRPMHLIILFDGTICASSNVGLDRQSQIVRAIVSNYTINTELKVAFGTPIMYNNFNFYGYSCSLDGVNRDINTINQWCYSGSIALDKNNDIYATMEHSMSNLYTPDTPAFAFIVLLRSNGSLSDSSGIKDAIHFRKVCLDSINAAVIVIQVDEMVSVDPNLASRPEFFFKYDPAADIGSQVTRALVEVTKYNMRGYVCRRSKSVSDTNPPEKCT
ncbi:hypothetical protein FO519_008294 [Halicephalobus sp. NKZ332]|nr:hypothetical protein FO519_008294 [Halicephalobus sp. NKZ332]